jgi:hypothetical protein
MHNTSSSYARVPKHEAQLSIAAASLPRFSRANYASAFFYVG